VTVTKTAFPTYASIRADIAAGLSEADAVAKATRQLADAIDDEAVEAVLARLRAEHGPDTDTPPE
jgi:uncharacterized membrane protein YqiK